MTGRALQAALLLAVAISVTACRETEKNRPLNFQPGVYQGPADEKLGPEQEKQLRERGNLLR